ncbi:MAG: hypothetical protein ACHQ50_07735 [Fimbriimonadales bacterium]
MTDLIDNEPIEEPSYEPEPLDEPEIDAEPESEPEPDTQELDYERIIGGVTERIAQAAQQYQMQQQAPPDPYAEVADMIWEDPQAAIQRTVDIATQNAVQAMMPYVQPVSAGYALHQVTSGLNEDGQQFVVQFIREKGIDPSLLNDPTVADLVRSKAELHQIKKSGQSRPIPFTEGVGGYPGGNIDAQTQRELNGIEKLYRNLNLKFEPAKLLRRMK